MGNKIKLILFGAGLVGRQVLPRYQERFDIIAFADNDPKKHNDVISAIRIIHPEQICQFDFDYIVITSTSIEPIKMQLVEIGIPKEQIKSYIEHIAIVKQRFPFDALFFIFLCLYILCYLIGLVLGNGGT